jgi:hypothetical protein
MPDWEIGEVDKLLHETFANDTTIKTLQGVSGAAKARVSGYVVVRDPNYFPNIYFYLIPGPDGPGQGTTRIQSNLEYDIEVRTKGAPTDNSEAMVDRINVLMKMKRTLTPDGEWVVASRRVKPISQPERDPDEPSIYYMRRGATYYMQVVRS